MLRYCPLAVYVYAKGLRRILGPEADQPGPHDLWEREVGGGRGAGGRGDRQQAQGPRLAAAPARGSGARSHPNGPILRAATPPGGGGTVTHGRQALAGGAVTTW
ncbi:hypothetical protein GCM10010502_20520 [Kitasatospora aureofaciens]|uniref:Uncharacterized protein n=1 Tax=Kitasatospora aureofaciens TaxID=1894 RepID=A0A8H9HJ79_KITAU|nr:hypothetical protein GCM10010502_20520 [Kitasatospora aureofaciens]